MTDARMQPSAGYALRLRLGLDNLPGTLGRMTTAIGEAGGDIDAVDLFEYRGNQVVPELLLKVRDVEHGQTIVNVQRQERRDRQTGRRMGPNEWDLRAATLAGPLSQLGSS